MNPPTPPLSCIVLAGGSGSRLQGEDKGLLEAGGRALVEILIDQLSAEVDDICISANRNLERYAGERRRVLPDDPEFADQGPLAGIATCLPACRQDHVLVCCCDMPLLPEGLASRLHAASRGHDAAVCRLQGRRQLLFVIHRRALPSIRTALAGQRRGTLAWLDGLDCVDLDVDAEPPVLLNINTPQDLARLRQWLQRS